MQDIFYGNYMKEAGNFGFIHKWNSNIHFQDQKSIIHEMYSVVKEQKRIKSL